MPPPAIISASGARDFITVHKFITCGRSFLPLMPPCSVGKVLQQWKLVNPRSSRAPTVAISVPGASLAITFLFLERKFSMPLV